MRKKYTLSDIKKAYLVDVKFEFGEEDLFERNSENDWHHDHWAQKNVWEYEEECLPDSVVLGYIESFPESVRIKKYKSMMGHRTCAPAKKRSPAVRVDVKKMF